MLPHNDEIAQAQVAQGAKAIVATSPGGATLEQLEQRRIPVVTVDYRPLVGRVFMAIRIKNRAHGQKACWFLGEKLGGTGTVVQLIAGYWHDIEIRNEAFAECMHTNFPGILVLNADPVPRRMGCRQG